MRGLPPPPSDVLHLVQTFDINGHDVSLGFWLFNPSNADMVPPEAATLLGLWFTTCLPSLLNLMHTGAVPSTCQLTASGLAYADVAPPSRGAWTGGQADNVATGLKWITGERGRAAWSLSYVPAVPDGFIADNYRLSSLGFGNLLGSAQELYSSLNALPSPLGTPQVVGTVHRSRSAAPLPTSTFAPFLGVVPTQKVVTIRRRIPAGRALSPS